MVRDYQQERERQLTAIENQTELEASEVEVVVFKKWLLGRAGKRA